MSARDSDVAPVTLTVVNGPDAERTWTMRRPGSYRIGRGADCDVHLTDQSVSRVQCELQIDENGYQLIDASSRWGTQVNGRKIERVELQSGMLIDIGDTQLRVTLAVQPQSTMAPRQVMPVSPKPAAPISTPRRVQSPPATTSMVIDAAMLPDESPPVGRTVDLNALVGQRFMQYRVDAVIARAASGMVYRAVDTRDNRTVALKIFWPALFEDEKVSARFLRSMQAMLPLEHEHLVKLIAAGRSQNLCFTASEFVDGESAAQLITRVGIAGMLDWRTVWKIALGLSKAVEYIHEKQVLHRNLRPHNMLIRKSDGSVKLGDSMLAKSLEQLGQDKVTQRGEIVGDLYYSAPEQVSGGVVLDQRTDLYCLGAAIYALLTGKPPFLGGPAELINQIMNVPPEPPTKTHLTIPASLEGVVLRLLAKHPDGRYANATLVRRDLERAGRLEGLT